MRWWYYKLMPVSLSVMAQQRWVREGKNRCSNVLCMRMQVVSGGYWSLRSISAVLYLIPFKRTDGGMAVRRKW